jgi:hypothetical protein
MGTVARVVEISATSEKSFEDAVTTAPHGPARRCATCALTQRAFPDDHIPAEAGR